MKQIIRSNAVETSSLQGNLGIQLSELHSRQTSITENSVLSRKVTLSVLLPSSDIVVKNKSDRSTSSQHQVLSAFLSVIWGNKLDFLSRVVFWVCTGKIAKVSHIPTKQMTTGTTKTLGKIPATAEQATPRTLVLKASLFKFLPKLQKTTQLAVKTVKTKTWLNNREVLGIAF
jgi:hypothetical protein